MKQFLGPGGEKEAEVKVREENRELEESGAQRNWWPVDLHWGSQV